MASLATRRLEHLFSAVARLVAQIFNLPYRRIIFGRVSGRSQALARCDATQITNLRYGRVQLCATLNTCKGFRRKEYIEAARFIS